MECSDRHYSVAMGRRRKRIREEGLWTPTASLPVSASHPFYQRLNQILDAKKFEAVRDWEARFAPLLAEQWRKGKVGRRLYVDETYLKVKGKWSYLYRMIDGAGNLVDSMLSATRDMAAAQRFFRGALSMMEKDPLQITTDWDSSYPRAIHEVLGPKVKHRCNAYLNRRIEQDHRGIKQRYYPMLGFGSLASGRRFCRAFEELRQYFRPRRKRKQFVPLAKQRCQFLFRTLTLAYLFEAA
jgi:putative transposase